MESRVNMNSVEKENILMNEYIKTYKNRLYLHMKVKGFVRFDIVNNKIEGLLSSTLVYRAFLLIFANMGVGYLVYISTETKNYLKIPDGMALIYFDIYANLLLINQTFVNRNSGLIILSQSFRTDAHMGIDNTRFMRDVEAKTFVKLAITVAFTDMIIGVFLYSVYDVNMTVHVIGSLFFFWLAFCYDDYCFFSLYTAFLALRVRYLNVALAKAGGVKLDYLSGRSLLNLFFWRKSFNDLVIYQNYATTEEYRMSFELVFKFLRVLEKYYNFPAGLGFTTIVVGTFVASQTYIERLKTGTKLDQETIITGWVLLSWGFIIIVSFFVDLVQQQIEETKLICACIQLKPNKPEVYKLSKTILRLLEKREPRLSVYNMYFFDTGTILRMASATLVYITVQLQLAFPKVPPIVRLNVTEEA